MNQLDVLTVAFLQARGVTVAKPLRDWLTRASFLARAQTDAAKRARYVRWALRTVEAAASAPGGVAAVKWAKQSTVMPPDATDATPAWWPDAEAAVAATASPPSSAARSALLAETLRRAPAELVPFVHQGFGLYDRDVARGQRTYEQVTFVEMLNIAKSLFVKAMPFQHPSAPPTQPEPRPQPATAPKERLPPAATPPAQQEPPQQPQQPQSTEKEKPPSPLPPSPPPYSSKPTSPQPAPRPHASAEPLTREKPAAAAPSPQKRSAPVSSYEPPAKKPHVTASTATATAVVGPLTDRSFFMQLAGTVEVESVPPPAFVGRSTAMERAYTRYEPLVEDIRPLPVLRKAFFHILRHAETVEATDGVKAGQKYLSDQLKGMRQDLRVQNIMKGFTLKVYEKHARLCLEMGDIGEFNQCQAALKQLYETLVGKTDHPAAKEFFLYRVVYLTLSEQYDSLSTELITFTNAQLSGAMHPGTDVDKQTVNRTLALCNACINGDTATICRLLVGFPVEMSYLVRIYLQKLRIMWLKEILTAMKGSLTMRFLMASLGFTPVVDGDAQPSSTFWLDGSAEEASARLVELFKTLKIDLPADFSFEAEVQRTKHTGPNPTAHFPSLDAASALKTVDEYLQYLGTRKDTGL